MSGIQNPSKSKYFEPLIALVSKGHPVRQVADQVGCSVAHAHDLSRTTEFRQAVAERRTATMVALSGRLVEAGDLAIKTLEECMSDSERDQKWIAAARIRLAAAKSLLSTMLPVSENTDLRQRMDQLSQEVAEQADRKETPS